MVSVLKLPALLVLGFVIGGGAPGEFADPDRPPADHAVSRLASSLQPATVGGLTWAERLEMEQQLAAGDARYRPDTSESGSVILRSQSTSARFSSSGAHIALGPMSDTEVVVAVRAFGREGDLQPVERAELGVAGPAVELARGDMVMEWWRSLPSGLEHGVTVQRRPSGEGPLVLEVDVQGLRAERGDDDTAILMDTEGRAVARYSKLLVFDADGVRLPARMRVVNGCVHLEAEDVEARYPLVVDPLFTLEEATLEPPGGSSGGTSGDVFGSTASLSGDGLRALIGAPYDDRYGRDVGSAHIFVRSGDSWVLEAALSIPAPARSGVGSAVSLNADGSRALVTVRGEFTSQGDVLVFTRSGSSWSEEARLRPMGTIDRFGRSVSLSADGNRAAVGSTGTDTPGGADAGSASIFVRTGTTWTEESSLIAAGGGERDYLGSSVSLSADGSRVLVGAPSDDMPSGVDAGSATVFVRSGSSWTEEAVLSDPSGQASDQFGGAVSLSADGSYALVGAVAGTAGTGSALVFRRVGSVWANQATLAIAGASADYFGRSVSLNAAGSRAIVGDSWTDRMPRSGSAHIFERIGDAWVEAMTLIPAAGVDYFGSAVSLSADGTRALVGAPGDGDGGSARVFVVGEQKADGATCETGLECLSGHCIDGVCCDSACGDGAIDCQACSAAAGGAANGTCTPLTTSAAEGVVCRSSAGVCDVSETCTTTSTLCPPDAFELPDVECRTTAGGCDVAETCTGSAPACPINVFAVAGTECRAIVSVCDVAEYCSGAGAACPADGFAPAGTECRAVAGVCDLAETCTGDASACPLDGFAADGTSCSNLDVCDGAELCVGGACAMGTLLSCEDDTPCTADSCDPVLGCTHVPVGGCCESEMDCDDADPCTLDTCSEDQGTCTHREIPACRDAGAARDAGVADTGVPYGDGGVLGDGGDAGDAGAEPDESAGCSCRVARQGHPGPAGWMLLVGFCAVTWRRRRRGSTHRWRR